MSPNRRNLGASGEDIAANHLCKNGYNVLKRNFRNRSGEIDIIARDGDVLTFIEVKTRRSEKHGSPAAAVTYRKQQQISKVALYYLALHNLFDHDARFDVVSILLRKNQVPDIEIIKNAFELIS
ncbi:YraN family protein [Desulfopila sp. IMCC35008]|uniref:YraN family protein n=1 Tax=Desulfopila sp. IMCC35008 TaxID=2653858 RepID=UPI0013D8A277|nr:YraN family protein [Desulfopila sp. IMCC35008]